MTTVNAILAAAVPTAIYTMIIWWLDRYEKEPLPLLAVAFFWGSAPAIGLALAIELALRVPAAQTFLGPGLVSWGLAPLVEELVKALAITALFIFARAEFDGPLDGIVYGALVGFGFSMTENLIYFLSYSDQLPALFWARGVVFGSSHAFFSSLVGLALGSARYARRPVQAAALAGGLAVAVLFHSLHNAAADYALPGLLLSWLLDAGGVVTILMVAALAWERERGWLLAELPEEVAAGVISDAEFAAVTSLSRRLGQRLGQLLAHGPRAYLRSRQLAQLISELAFCKHQVRIGDPFRSCDERDRIRREIAQLRASLQSNDVSYS